VDFTLSVCLSLSMWLCNHLVYICSYLEMIKSCNLFCAAQLLLKQLVPSRDMQISTALAVGISGNGSVVQNIGM
jgi:hypothetical protein